jgi:hypothetical protein
MPLIETRVAKCSREERTVISEAEPGASRNSQALASLPPINLFRAGAIFPSTVLTWHQIGGSRGSAANSSLRSARKRLGGFEAADCHPFYGPEGSRPG